MTLTLLTSSPELSCATPSRYLKMPSTISLPRHSPRHSPRRSPRLAERERHTAAKAADVAPKTFVSAPAPTAIYAETVLIHQIRERMGAVDRSHGLAAKTMNATLLMNFLHINALSLIQKSWSFRSVVIAKCLEFSNYHYASEDLKESCAALLARITAMNPPALAAHAPAPAVTAAQVAAFSAPTDDDCAFFASCAVKPPTEIPLCIPPRPTPSTDDLVVRIPPRPTALNKDSAIAHMKFLLNLNSCTKGEKGSIQVVTEIFEYAIVTSPLLIIPHKKLRVVIKDKITLIRDQISQMGACERLHSAMRILSDLIAVIDANEATPVPIAV